MMRVIRFLKILTLKYRKEKIYIKGESGSGKSTLVNIISGLIPCEFGSLLINNINITSQFRISNLGYITQRPFFISSQL